MVNQLVPVPNLYNLHGLRLIFSFAEITSPKFSEIKNNHIKIRGCYYNNKKSYTFTKMSLIFYKKII